MSSTQMTPAERVAYHALRVRECLRQAEDPLVRSMGNAAALLDLLVYAHAFDAAHAAREGRESC